MQKILVQREESYWENLLNLELFHPNGGLNKERLI